MDDVAKHQIVGLDLKTGFFPGLSAHRGARSLAAINVARDNAVLPVLISGIEALQQKEPALVLKNQVYFRDKTKTRHILTVLPRYEPQ